MTTTQHEAFVIHYLLHGRETKQHFTSQHEVDVWMRKAEKDPSIAIKSFSVGTRESLGIEDEGDRFAVDERPARWDLGAEDEGR